MYLVELATVSDNVSNYTVCINNSELSALMNNLDDSYYVVDIVTLKGRMTEFTEFCKKEENLETGKEQK